MQPTGIKNGVSATTTTANPPVIDLDNVPETLCDGVFHVFKNGPLVTLTFTHVRPIAADVFRDGKIDSQSLVRARIVMPINNVLALREVLNHLVQTPEEAAPPAGGSTGKKH